MRGAARAWLTAAGAALLTCACGQKGPLYLPDKGGTVVTRTPAATQAQPATPAGAAPAAAAPAAATPAAPQPPKPADKDKDQDQPPKP
jgi:predicted small lipoprotein YifL